MRVKEVIGGGLGQPGGRNRMRRSYEAGICKEGQHGKKVEMES